MGGVMICMVGGRSHEMHGKGGVIKPIGGVMKSMGGVVKR